MITKLLVAYRDRAAELIGWGRETRTSCFGKIFPSALCVSRSFLVPLDLTARIPALKAQEFSAPANRKGPGAEPDYNYCVNVSNAGYRCSEIASIAPAFEGEGFTGPQLVNGIESTERCIAQDVIANKADFWEKAKGMHLRKFQIPVIRNCETWDSIFLAERWLG
jgi:hypothetical protein